MFFFKLHFLCKKIWVVSNSRKNATVWDVRVCVCEGEDFIFCNGKFKPSNLHKFAKSSNGCRQHQQQQIQIEVLASGSAAAYTYSQHIFSLKMPQKWHLRPLERKETVCMRANVKCQELQRLQTQKLRRKRRRRFRKTSSWHGHHIQVPQITLSSLRNDFI